VKEDADEEAEGWPRARDLPSEEEGLKRSQSGRSSPDTVDCGENGSMEELSSGLERGVLVEVEGGASGEPTWEGWWEGVGEWDMGGLTKVHSNFKKMRDYGLWR
jgi:hypothetical protein